MPNVTLVRNAEVIRLETDASGRAVTGVVVDRGGDGKEEVYRADIVVLAAGAANTAKILLRSASDAHPAGLANGSDQVGRNYMFHNSKAVSGFGAEPNETVFQKTLGVNDFYLPGDGRPWPLGNIQLLGKSSGGAMKGEEPHLTKLVPHWSLDEAARHAVDFWLTTEDLPKPDNRVTVDRDGDVHLDYIQTNESEAADLYEEMKKILNHVGLAKHHVLHKSFYMSTNIPVNPGLTVMANAIRVGEHIAERLGASTATEVPAPRTAQGGQRHRLSGGSDKRIRRGDYGDTREHPGRQCGRTGDLRSYR
jgi:choline dehydrogenase-like flavoprotein